MDRTLRMPDGRILAFVDEGDPDGAVVFLHNGMPTSRLIYCSYSETARAVWLRLISADRLGPNLCI